MASQNIVVVTDSNFESEVVKSSLPMLVDFWATWCTPVPCSGAACGGSGRRSTPARFAWASATSMRTPMVPTQLEIRSIPTLLMFKAGQVVGQVVGAVPRARIQDLVKKAL
jgi:thioredoxin 1